MKKIKLEKTQLYVMIDDDDYKKVKAYRWHAHNRNLGGRSLYAACYQQKSLGASKAITFLHDLIMNPPDRMQVDHIDFNTLDCRKSNMRIATYSQNQANRRKTIKYNTTSEYKGVSFHANVKRKKWHAHITINGHSQSLGYFHKEIEAAKAYDKKAVEAWGEFANTNF